MKYIQEIELQMDKKCVEHVLVKQGDSGRYLSIVIFNNDGTGFDLTDKTVRFHAKKPDEKEIFNDCEVVNAKSGQVEVQLTNQTLACEGIAECEVVIKDANEITLSTMTFYLDIDKNNRNEDAIESTNEFSALDNALAETNRYNQYFKETNGELEKKYTTRLTENETKISYQELQTALFSQYYRKLSEGTAVTAVLQGDSLMYGVDRNSSDKRNPKSDPTLDKDCPDTAECQASITMPEAVQKFCNEVYGTGKVTIINRGFSGDWAEKSYERWTVNPNADIVFLRLGMNDGYVGADWIPSDIIGNMTAYVNSMRKIIERYLKWGTAVVLMSITRTAKQENFTSGYTPQSYRNALKQLATEYNCPLIPCEHHMNGCNKSYYSDGVHMTGKGYSHDASQIMAFFIGFMHEIPHIKSGDILSVRRTRDNFLNNDTAEMLESTGTTGFEEYTTGSGTTYRLKKNGTMYYSIKTLEDNLVLIPIFYKNSGTLQVTLDFNTEQGSFVDLLSVGAKANERYKAKSQITTAESSSSKVLWDGTINPTTDNRYLLIANRGYHTIKVQNIGTDDSSDIRFNGFIAIDFNTFQDRYMLSKVGGRKYEIYTHTAIADTTNVTESVISMSSLMDVLNFNYSSEYWKNPILKIQVQNYDQAILEYLVQIGTTSAGSTSWKTSLNKTTNLVSSPDSSQIRTITSVNLETGNNIKIAYGGATTRATKVVITVL